MCIKSSKLRRETKKERGIKSLLAYYSIPSEDAEVKKIDEQFAKFLIMFKKI